ncbi:MAG: CDP-alcohol phosphatidyltransferase family protein [Ignavibacteriales bacterium]|nr:CDP-alcohol phosphatidyltransferase family protein [Ignavibacteriales bacterium]
MSRVVLLIPGIYFLLENSEKGNFIFLLLLFIGALTDFLDGYFARRFNQITELGKILDPIADKICIGSVILTLMLLGKLPFWFLLLILIRDVLIFSGGVYVKSSTGKILQSNKAGKWAVAVTLVPIFLSVMIVPSQQMILNIFLLLSSVMLLVSFLLYLKRFFATLKGISS